MRTRNIPPELAHKHWYKNTCEFSECFDPTYFSTTPTSKCCCDDHRFKKYQLANKAEIDQAKFFTAQFKKNGLGLKKLYSKGIINPTQQELNIVDFDFKVRTPAIKIAGTIGHEYFDYILIIGKDHSFIISKKNKKS